MALVDHAAWSTDGRYIYFEGRTDAADFSGFRVRVPEGTLDVVADLGNFISAPEAWFGTTPNGNLLGLRGVTAQDIYALQCRLP